MHRRSAPVAIAALSLLAMLAGGCFASEDSSPTPAPTGEPAPERRPIIIDADQDISDLVAIAVLLRDPEVDVRAIAIDGTGLVHCQGGRRVTQYLLDEFGVPDIPFGCGREDGGPDARPFPDEWRVTADDAYGLDITPRAGSATPRTAVDVIREAVDTSPSAPTIVALGPLTNLEDAFAGDPTLPDRIAGIHAMLGTVDAPGNVFVDGHDGSDPFEWNAFADPSAVEAVFATDVPIVLVPLDATVDVPVPSDLAERLATDHSAAGADFFYELLTRFPARMAGAEGQQLWDELAALTLTSPTLATWGEIMVVVGPKGELVRDDAAGRSVGYANGADRPAVEAALLEALRRGGPRATPFVLAGTLTGSFDGTTCALSADAAVPGPYELRYTGPEDVPSQLIVVNVHPPKTWADLQAFAATVDVDAIEATPEWFTIAGEASDSGDGVPGPAAGIDVPAGTVGPVCLTGTWPDLVFTPGDPFEVTE
jgi:inosine-uridine nucleoside N-ribohydrolase